MESQMELPKEIEVLLQTQQDVIDKMANHFEVVNVAMSNAATLLQSWTPEPLVLQEIKFLVLGKIAAMEQDPAGTNFNRLEVLKKAANWLELFPQGES